MLLSIGSPGSNSGLLQLRIGPVPSLFQYLWNGPPVVTVKGGITVPTVAATITTPTVRGTITTPTVVGATEV